MSAFEVFWYRLREWVIDAIQDPTVQGIAGTLAVGAFVLFVIIRET